MRVPSSVVDYILDKVRSTLPKDVRLERMGLHGVSAVTTHNGIHGFVDPPWPLPLGPKRLRIKSCLAEFTDSLVKLVSTASGEPWPDTDQAVKVHVSRTEAVVAIGHVGAELSIDVPLKYWVKD